MNQEPAITEWSDLRIDGMEPGQFAYFNQSHHLSGEQRLWLEAVKDAVDWATKNTRSKSHVYARLDEVRQEAREWIADTSDSFRSFVWSCHQLELDPDALRSGVMRAIREGRHIQLDRRMDLV